MNWVRLFPLLAALCLSPFFLGCDSDDDGENVMVPDGKSVLYINNDSVDVRVNTFIDGEQQVGRTGGDNERAFTVEPGEHIVMLVDDRDDDVIYLRTIAFPPGRVFVLDVENNGSVDERLE